jgi:hypothetical protein
VSNPIKLNVFGKRVSAQKTEQGWEVFFLGDDGRKRPAYDLVIPSFISEDEIESYLSDICHEWATDKNKDVYKLS